MGMDIIPSRYGRLSVDGPMELHPDGQVRAAFLAGPVDLDTSLGRLRPQHTIDDTRHMTLAPVTFHRNGQVRSLPLETRTVLATPVGDLPAELVTFHENGAVARVFPLNGKLSGYWTEADEARLADPLTVATPLGPVTARIVAVAFDPLGRLRSLTLWPEEEVAVKAPVGQAPVRMGLSFYADGALRSLEPARPLEVPTPVGPVWAFDPDAVGVSGDDNSLVFSPSGEVLRVATVRTAVSARLPDGTRQVVTPGTRESLCGDSELEAVALVLEFSLDAVTARTAPKQALARVPLVGTVFTTRPHITAFATPLKPRRCAS
jgi:hypothetical protein